MKRADADLAVTSCQSEDALQHGDRESSSSSSPSPVDSLEGLAEIDPRLVHTDPRLPAGPLSAAGGFLTDPLVTPVSSVPSADHKELLEDCHDSESTPLGENDVLKKIEAPSAHLSMGTPWDEDYVDPRLARPNRPFAPFGESPRTTTYMFIACLDANFVFGGFIQMQSRSFDNCKLGHPTKQKCLHPTQDPRF
jgi:hypothetical protein